MSIEEKRKAWDVIFSEASLSSSSLRYRATKGYIDQNGLRSVYWKIFLEYLPASDISNWSSLLQAGRQRYTDLKTKYIQEPTDQPVSNDDYSFDEIKIIIQQDVERTFPTVEYFRDEKVQKCLVDILYIYSQLNPDTSYRQGMHELLAPFYWVLALDAVDRHQDYDESSSMNQVLDTSFIEHDAFCLFEKLMYHGKTWYEYKDDTIDTLEPTEIKPFNPVVITCQRIHHEYLSTIDPFLYQHLEDFGIEPQLYGLRWIRLLFGREFDLHELLKLWDAVFAHDPTFQIVEYICLVILLYLRDQLLRKDYTECLCLLMNSVSISLPSITLFEQAKSLQEELTQGTALTILQYHDTYFDKEPRKSMSYGVTIQRPLNRRASSITLMGRAFTSALNTVQKNMSLFNKKPPRQKVPPISTTDMNELMAQYIHVLESEIFGKQDEANIMTALSGLKHIRETVFEKHNDPSVMSSSSDEWDIETPESTLFGSVSEMIPIYEGYELDKPLPPILYMD